jgi:hypothetical protein
LIITNALGACCEVVIDEKSTSGSRGSCSFNDIVGVHTYEGEYLQSNTLWDGEKLNQPTYVSGLFPCIILNGKWNHIEKARVPNIGIMMPKSKRRLE